MTAALIVIAKEPRAGHSKTRLTPPCTPDQAAGLAEAALRDTLHAVAETRTHRRIVALDGVPGAWLPDGFEVISQRGFGLEERLAAAFEDVGEPALLVGMDTPQLTPALLAAGRRALGSADAAFGPALDGGYWAIGLRQPDRRVFTDVPMSEPTTGHLQRARLDDLALTVADLPALRDVDTIDDARAVAALAPHSGFARAFAAIVPWECTA